MNKKFIIISTVALCIMRLEAMEKPVLFLTKEKLQHLQKAKPSFDDKSIGVFRKFIDKETGVEISYCTYGSFATRNNLIFGVLPGASTYATIYKGKMKFYADNQVEPECEKTLVFNPKKQIDILRLSTSRFQRWQDTQRAKKIARKK